MATHVRYVGDARIVLTYVASSDSYRGSIELLDGTRWPFTDHQAPAYMRQKGYDPDEPDFVEEMIRATISFGCDRDANQRGTESDIKNATEGWMRDDGSYEMSIEAPPAWRAKLFERMGQRMGQYRRGRGQLNPGDGRRRASRSEVMPFGDLVDALELYNDNTDGDYPGGGETVFVFLWDDDWQLMSGINPEKHKKEWGGQYVRVRIPGHNKPFDPTREAKRVFDELGLRHLNPGSSRKHVEPDLYDRLQRAAKTGGALDREMRDWVAEYPREWDRMVREARR